MRQQQPVAARRHRHGEQLARARNDGRLFRIGEIAQVNEAVIRLRSEGGKRGLRAFAGAAHGADVKLANMDVGFANSLADASHQLAPFARKGTLRASILEIHTGRAVWNGVVRWPVAQIQGIAACGQLAQRFRRRSGLSKWRGTERRIQLRRRSLGGICSTRRAHRNP